MAWFEERGGRSRENLGEIKKLNDNKDKTKTKTKKCSRLGVPVWYRRLKRDRTHGHKWME